MNLLLRLIWLFATAFRKTPIGILDDSVIQLRVLPTDLDLNFHMNNGRYLTIMDLGRFDWLIRSGLMKVMIKNKYSPVAASVAIRFRRAIGPFQKYQLRTRVLAWDEKWIYLGQTFECRGSVVATALVKALVRGGRNNVPSNELINMLGPNLRSPPLLPALEHWKKLEAEL